MSPFLLLVIYCTALVSPLASTDTSPIAFLLLVLYCSVLVALALVGGWLPSVWHWTHVKIQLVMSFIAGFMLAVALVQLLPHAYGLLPDGRLVGMSVMAGLLVMFFLIRIFDYHHHHFADTPKSGSALNPPRPHQHSSQCDHEHTPPDEAQPNVILSCAHEHDHTSEIAAGWSGRSNGFASLGLLIGLGLHSIIEAIALAAALQAGASGGSVLLPSFGIFLAIALHKPLDAISIASVMTVSRWTKAEKTWVIVIYALSGPLAAFLAFFGFAWLPADTKVALGFALAFSAGTFLCISLGDLLPELHFHSHDRVKLSVCLLAGVGLVILLELLPFMNHAS